MNPSTDLHSALRTETVGSNSTSGVHLKLVKLQSGKTDIKYSLHACPSEFSTAGIQWTDVLSYIGFSRTRCPFHHGDAYCRFVDASFNLEACGHALSEAYRAVQVAERHFEACGYWLPRPEGFGYFYGKPSGSNRQLIYTARGDGHTSAKGQQLKVAEDANFEFALSWIEGGQDRGWTTHYRSKQGAASEEIQAVFNLISLRRFQDCPEFEFEPCYWRFTPYENRDNGFGNADMAHRFFDGHAANFSSAVEAFLAAEACLEPFGFTMLQISERPQQRQSQYIGRKIVKPARPPRAMEDDQHFDVAISFAGTNREMAERLAAQVRDAGFSVFYDGFYGAELWGKNLVEFFDDIYRKRSRYCVMFISEDYRDRAWTIHERRSAQARAIEEKGAEYILPIRVDGTELPGMPTTIGHVALHEHGIDEIAQMLIQKLTKRA